MPRSWSATRLEAGQQLALLVLVAGLERAAHVVHDRQQGLDDRLGGAQALLLLLALRALAVVVPLGLEAAQVVEVLVALARDHGELVGDGLCGGLGDLRLGGLAGHGGLCGQRLGGLRGLRALRRRVSCASCPSCPFLCLVSTRGLAAAPSAPGSRRGEALRPAPPAHPAALCQPSEGAPAVASTVFLALTSMRCGFSSSAFGTVTVRMPSS